jgi:hypothetical protein
MQRSHQRIIVTLPWTSFTDCSAATTGELSSRKSERSRTLHRAAESTLRPPAKVCFGSKADLRATCDQRPLRAPSLPSAIYGDPA